MTTLRAALILGLLTLTSVTLGAATLGAPPLAEAEWSTRVPADAGEVDLLAAALDPVVLPPLGTDAADPTFGPGVRVSNTDRIGEPGVKIDGNGVVYVHAPGRLWRSTDGGASFVKLTLSGATGPLTCGCDADMSIDDLNNIIWTDLAYPNCVNAGASVDKGDHFLSDRYACSTEYGGGMDRQWIETEGQLFTYLTYRIGGTIYMAVSSPAASPVFVSLGPANQFGSNFRAGYLAVDRTSGHAYLSYTSGTTVRVAVVLNGVVLEDRLVANTGGSNLDAFSAPAVDQAGNVYVVWNERGTVNGASITKSMLAASSDHGHTWGAPRRIDVTATSVFPWIVAGAEGKVGIVYYGSSDAKLPGSVTGDWFVHYVYGESAQTGSPSFTDVVAVPTKVKTGPICTGGTGCASGTRTFLDFFGVHVFPDGRAGIAYNDNTGLTPTQAPYVYFAPQVDGPRLL